MMPKNIRLKKPIEPRKPTKPQKPKEFKTVITEKYLSVDYHYSYESSDTSGRNGDRIHSSEIFNHVSPNQEFFISIQKGWYDGDCPSYYICYPVEVKNSQYAKQLVQYEQKLKKYEHNIKVYEEKRKEYTTLMKAYVVQEIENKIKKDQAKLKKLKKQI